VRSLVLTSARSSVGSRNRSFGALSKLAAIKPMARLRRRSMSALGATPTKRSRYSFRQAQPSRYAPYVEHYPPDTAAASLRLRSRQAVARMEGEIVLKALAERIERLELAAPPVRRLNNTLRGLASLPLSVAPRRD
jgi:hypothetical protein